MGSKTQSGGARKNNKKNPLGGSLHLSLAVAKLKIGQNRLTNPKLGRQQILSDTTSFSLTLWHNQLQNRICLVGKKY